MRSGVLLIVCLVLAGETVIGAEAPGPQAVTYNYDILRTRIASGQASLAEVRNALTDQDAGGLTNTMHALYSMRWHRGVNHLLEDMWQLNTAKYPEISWDIIREPPVRIALASTISRIQVADIGKYLDYIRSFRDHEHEFIRAQVVIALGLNGYKEDVPYIKSMADGDNHYVAQSAITALALMNSNPAKDALIDLWFKHKDTPRQQLIQEVLDRAYGLVPKERPKGQAEGN
jgi:hypothetical protein